MPSGSTYSGLRTVTVADSACLMSACVVVVVVTECVVHVGLDGLG